MSFTSVSDGPEEALRADDTTNNQESTTFSGDKNELSVNGNNVKITLDWLLANRLGEFGRYQKKVLFFYGIPVIFCAINTLAWVFLGANIPHRCTLDNESPENASYSELTSGHTFNDSFPWDSERNSWSQCSKYSDNVDHGVLDLGNSENGQEAKAGKFAPFGLKNPGYTIKSKDDSLLSKEDIIGCDGKFVYDNSQNRTSARIDFKLICENEFWYTFVETMQKIGIFVGAIFFGSLSDRFGRRRAFFLALCVFVSNGILCAFAPIYFLFVVTRFVNGVSISGIFLVAFVAVIELVGDSYRVKAAVGIQLYYALGFLLEVLIAYYIRDWRELQLAFTLPALLFLTYNLFMPESVRWLLATKKADKREEAIKYIKILAKCNDATIPESELSRLNDDANENSTGGAISWSKVCSYRKTMCRSFNIFFCWFVNSGVYFGLAMNTGNLGGNDYFNFLLLGLVEVPAIFILMFVLDRYGRRITLSGTTLLGGVFLIACGVTPPELTWLVITFNTTGKFFNAAAYATLYIYSAEVFPTVLRNSFMGISSMSARVGGIISDFCIQGQSYWKPLPHITFGSASLACGLLTCLLPETLSKRLPDTLEEAEMFGTSAYDGYEKSEPTEEFGEGDKPDRKSELDEDYPFSDDVSVESM